VSLARDYSWLPTKSLSDEELINSSIVGYEKGEKFCQKIHHNPNERIEKEKCAVCLTIKNGFVLANFSNIITESTTLTTPFYIAFPKNVQRK